MTYELPALLGLGGGVLSFEETTKARIDQILAPEIQELKFNQLSFRPIEFHSPQNWGE